MYYDNPRSHSMEKIKENLYASPFGMFIAGSEENVRGMTRKQLLEKHRSIYSPKNSILCVVGDNNFDEVVMLAEKLSVEREFSGLEIPEIKLINKNSSEKRAKDLDEYKRIHEYEKKKIAILEFMEKNLSQLRRAEETYGIPKETIAAIFGIESNFARGSGRFNPFNAYVSMHVKGIRSDLAIPQLIELLKFCRKNSINVFDLKSSYAGAMSYAQFIPSSLNNWLILDIFLERI